MASAAIISSLWRRATVELFENVGLLYIKAFVNTLVKETSSGPYEEEWLEVAKHIAHCCFIPMSSP